MKQVAILIAICFIAGITVQSKSLDEAVADANKLAVTTSATTYPTKNDPNCAWFREMVQPIK